jgi:hypothetical protein
VPVPGNTRAASGPHLAVGVRIGPRLAAGVLMLACVFGARGQDYTDAISREFTVFNDLVSSVPPNDAVTREFTVFNDLVSSVPPNDAISREFTVVNVIAGEFVSSSNAAEAWPVSGTLPQQLAALNATPPAYDPNTWLPVYRKNDNLDDAFVCGQVPDALAREYVSADWYLLDADEVTQDNCNSAFYRFAFELPSNAWGASLSGSANVDPQGIVFANGNRISGLMTTLPPCNPTGGPNDPCYGQQDAGHDRSDAQGTRILTWPTLDGFGSVQTTYLHAGVNELVFGVCGPASYYRPTGVEFDAVVLYWLRGDLNCDGAVDFGDINPFVLALSNPAAYAAVYPACNIFNGDCDGNGYVDFGDINPFVAILSGGD